MRKLNAEDRLLRRITQLRTLLRHTANAEIIIAVNELISDTEIELVTLQPDRMRKLTHH
jgi:hypothetical protein